MEDRFGQYSDTDLETIAYGKQSDQDLSGFSDEELEQIANGPSITDQIYDSAKNIGAKTLKNVVIPVGRAVDSYTGAPVRKAIGAYQDDKNPAYAFMDQFGANPDLAPSGKEIAQKAGFSESSLSDVLPDLFNETGEGWKFQKGGWADPTASGAAGLGVDLVADWTNILPPSALAKALLKGGTAGAKASVKGSAKAVDLATGTKTATTALDTAGKAVERVTNPQRVPDWAEIVRVAEENNISPESLSEAIEFGPDSFIARSTRHLAEGPAGEKYLTKHNEGLQELSEAMEGRTQKIGLGEKPNASQAGQIAREGFKNANEEFFSKMDITHGSIIKSQPGLMVDREAMEKLGSVANGIEKYAKGLVTRGIDDVDVAQGKYLLRAVDQLKNSKRSYKQMHEALLSIRKKAFSNKQIMGQIPHDVDKMRDLYFAGNDALIDTVRKHVNPDFADEIISNNAQITDRLRNKSLISKEMLEQGMPDEQVFNRLIGNTKKIQAFKKSVKPETFQKLKAAYLNKMISYNKDGGVNFSKMVKDLKKQDHIVKELFDPAELQGIQELAELGSKYGPGILSSSGTGASLGFRDIVSSISRGVMNEKVIEKLKSKARNASSLPSKALRNNRGEVSSDVLMRLLGGRENKAAQALKASQVSSAVDQDNRSLNYFLRNPKMIEYIKNPKLKEAMEKQINQDRDEAPFSTGTISDRSARERFVMGN